MVSTQKVNELNHILTVLNLMYKFNDLVLFIKKKNFQKNKINRTLIFKYPSWEQIFSVLEYFEKYIINENDKVEYNTYIKIYKNNTNLRKYYEDLIYS